MSRSRVGVLVVVLATIAFPGRAPADTAPTIGGTVAVGQTLTCVPGSGQGSGLAYRWLRDGEAILDATQEQVYGHSWSQGYGASNLYERSWASLLARWLGLPVPSGPPEETNGNGNGLHLGVGATIASGSGNAPDYGVPRVLQRVTRSGQSPPFDVESRLAVVFAGYNDAYYNGPGAGSDAALAGALRAAIGRYLALAVFESSHPSVTYNGRLAPAAPDWTAASFPGLQSGTEAVYTTRNGSYLEIAIPSWYEGQPITIGMPIAHAGARGTVAFSLDGAPFGAPFDQTPASDAIAARRTAPIGYSRSGHIATRLTGIPPGAHTLRLTYTGPTGFSFAFDYWSIETDRAAVVVPLFPPSTPHSHVSRQDWADPAARSNAVLRRLVAEYGPNVIPVDLTAAMTPRAGTAAAEADREYWHDELHPNDAGYERVAAAIHLALGAGSVYVPAEADALRRLACRVDPGDATPPATSDPVTVPAALPRNTEAPVVSGPGAVGRALTCEPGTWTRAPAPVLSRQWLGDGEPIAGAQGEDYTVAAADAGRGLACRVTATNPAGSSSATSAAVAIPAPDPPPPPAPPPDPGPDPVPVPVAPGPGPAAVGTAAPTTGGRGGATSTTTTSTTNGSPGSPASAGRSAALDGTAVAVGRLASLPSAGRCVSGRRMRVALRSVAARRIVLARIGVDGRVVRTLRGGALRRAVALRGLPTGRFSVQVFVRRRSGARETGERSYRACAVSRGRTGRG